MVGVLAGRDLDVLSSEHRGSDTPVAFAGSGFPHAERTGGAMSSLPKSGGGACPSSVAVRKMDRDPMGGAPSSAPASAVRNLLSLREISEFRR